MPEVYVGLGSNVAPVENLIAARAGLRAEFGALRLSGVYRSAPVGFTGDDFLNLVVGFASAMNAAEINARLSVLEEAHGRVRPSPGLGPRTLDLDLLLVGHRVDPGEHLPHTDILLYSFVLRPLVELAPALAHPVTGAALQAVWSARAAHGPELAGLGSLDGLGA